jgi:capsular polysaccharide biosynthesis protein
MSHIEHIAPMQCRPARMITARSYLLDRFVPDCEVIALPSKTVQGGELGWTRGYMQFATRRPGSKNLLKRLVRPVSVRADPDDILFDFRLQGPRNWAHFLTNHLPLFFHIAHVEGLAYDTCRLVMPKDIPDYIVSAAALFRVLVLKTDAEIQGKGVDFNINPWMAGRPARRTWVAQRHAEQCLQAAEAAAGPSDLPERVFISRRGRRCLENEAEVTDFLADRGYVRLYAEDLSPLDQFWLFRHAREIVAIHGAALAPLLYCSDTAHPTHLVELFPCDHMTDVFRVIAQLVGCDWIGVRGKIKPEHVAPAYALTGRFTKYSLQSFEIDLHALKQALDTAGEVVHV